VLPAAAIVGIAVLVLSVPGYRADVALLLSIAGLFIIAAYLLLRAGRRD
jgi:hypothetical protein